jgi:WD40 repeat protein
VFVPGDRVATAGDDGAVRLLGPGTAGAESVIRHTDNAATSVDVSRDGSRLLSAGTDHTVRVARTAEPYGARILVRGMPTTAEFSPDGARIVTANEDGVVRTWAADGTPERVLRGHEGLVWRASFSPDGRQVVSAGADGTVRVWSLSSGGMLVVRAPKDVLSADSDDGASLLAGVTADGRVRLWRCEVCGPMQAVEAAAGRRWTPE